MTNRAVDCANCGHHYDQHRPGCRECDCRAWVPIVGTGGRKP